MAVSRVLVANRGEIACRIFRTLRRMGIGSVAVFSEADRGALHTRLADDAIEIGPPAAAESYLSIPRILEAARLSGADAIHPGYGFLSERAEFAEAVIAAGLTFIGPSASAMRALGAKIAAKELAQRAGAPIVPGWFAAGATDDELIAAAKEMGLPVMLKASAGGGGRGMRVVRKEEDLADEILRAREEAMSGFGDDDMMVERLIERPRHIEVQVLADAHGQVACLFERECSLQRRRQKVLEEAPSPVMSPEVWARMQEAARMLILEADYVGAGTVEFITDAAGEEFFFLEVNARLQVEHPVTEQITGLDMVEQQVRIARGERLALPEALMTGDRRAISGHSIEVRIISEDPAQGFLPSAGPIIGWAEPQGPGIRVDSGVEEGSEASRHYDSLLAKLIVHGADRAAAFDRLRQALMDTHLLGPKTNISFLLDLIDRPEVRAGEMHTSWIEEAMAEWKPPTEIPAELGSLVQSAAPPAALAGLAESAPAPAWTADGFRIVRS
jgi:acetyl/propionyl-CoA carboxylase alpha subunit